MRAQLRYQAAGTLTHRVREGRPEELPTAVLYDRAGASLGSVTVTQDPLSTTLATSAVDGARTLTLTSASYVVPGEEYLVIGSGRQAWVRALSVSGAVVTLADGLAGTFAAGASVVSTKVSLAVTSAGTDKLEENRHALLTYVVDGATYTDHVWYDVVRFPWPAVILTTAEYRRVVGPLAAPELERGGAEDLRYADEIAEATELLRTDIVDRGLRPDLFLDHTAFRRPIAFRVLLEKAYLADGIPYGWKDSPETWLTTCQERYDQALAKALTTAQTYDDNEDGKVPVGEAQRRLGTIRIVR